MWWCNKKNFIYIEVPLYRKCKETLYLICNLVFWLYNCDTKAMRFMNYLQFFIRKKLHIEVLKLERAIQQQRLFIYLLFFLFKISRKNLIFEKFVFWNFEELWQIYAIHWLFHCDTTTKRFLHCFFLLFKFKIFVNRNIDEIGKS